MPGIRCWLVLRTAIGRSINCLDLIGFMALKPVSGCCRLALVGVACCFPMLVWGAPLTVTVQQAAIVQGPQITIGDVAVVHGDSPRLVARIRDIIIGQSPPAGQERSLYGGYIQTRLKQHGFQPQDVQLELPKKIFVTRAHQRLEPRDIEARVIRAIHAQTVWSPQHTTIRSMRGIEPVILPPGPVQSEIIFPINADFLGPTSFTVLFRVAGNLEHRLYGTARIEVSEDIAITSRPLPRHHVINSADLRLTRVNLARLPRRLLMQPEDIIGKRTKRPLQANAMIHAYEVEVAPVVREGDAVLILVDSPLLKVSTLGEAIEPGQQGETIRVRNLSSQREIRAIVVDKKTVKVPF